MILHCVFARFKSSLQAADKQSLYDAIVALKEVTPGILDIKYGPNISREGLDGGFRDGFIVTFDSPESRDAYLVHPDHLAVGERIVASADGGVSGLLVFDLEI
ncbi:stress responsive protein [Neorhizobium sp. SOG26]|jgi:Stress responsive A/B Barrel Domain.|uniref:Dabb family protein n=1 Tax=Neorhizobium turbinariae TaxID=2937795 RepID=A0ABT0IRZ6_9HYPH|nr:MULTISPECIES: Dabb family protein [Neorhizobium]AXV14626.1 stress responsive protein [Neorhizobium sp. SOG26]MCK8780625.1 Dabb family protein [Neorhizobium turbinariae]